MNVLFLLEGSPRGNGRFLKMKASIEAAGGSVKALWPAEPYRLRQIPIVGGLVDWKIREAKVRQSATKHVFDIIHVMHYSLLRVAIHIRQSMGSSVIYDAAEAWDSTPFSDAATANYVRSVEQNWASHADAVLTVSRSLQDRWANTYQNAPTAHLIRNTAPSADDTVYDGRLHAAVGLPKNQHIALYQGGFGRGRGLPELASEACRLPQDWALVLMGNGEMKTAVEGVLRDDPSLTGKLFLLPPAPFEELNAWTCGASLGVIPYQAVCDNHRFCLPNKLFEFAASGVPILAPDDLIEVADTIRCHNLGWAHTHTQPLLSEFRSGRLTHSELKARRQSCLTFSAANTWEAEGEALIAVYEASRRMGPLASYRR